MTRLRKKKKSWVVLAMCVVARGFHVTPVERLVVKMESSASQKTEFLRERPIDRLMVKMEGESDWEEQKRTFLRERLGATTEEDLAKLELALSYQKYKLDRARTNCDALQERLGFTNAELQRIVCLLPAVLRLRYDRNLGPSLEALQRRLNLTDAELKKLLLKLPAIFGYCYETNIEPSLKALQDRLKLTEAELKKIVLYLPCILGLNFHKTVNPKLNFIQTELDIDVDELRNHVLQLPALMAYSLNNRLRPRVTLCREVGEDLELGITRASMTDSKFAELLERRRTKRILGIPLNITGFPAQDPYARKQSPPPEADVFR